MRTILYLMHVDWRWAKQRPHFIAEGLSRYYRVSVRFPPSYHKALISNTSASPLLSVHALRRLPFERFQFVGRINRLLARIQLIYAARSAPIVWITHPGMYELVKGNLSKNALLVYDCMDDVLEFPHVKGDKNKEQEIAALERGLIKRTSLTLASSSYLKMKLEKRYGVGKNIHVVNNGVRALLNNTVNDINLDDILGSVKNMPGKKILYVGTISEWFDFDLVLKSLNEVDDISYVLVGPCEITPPGHERLIALPPVQHSQVAALLDWADALVMPFHLTELIRSVNPVKVYEYIYAQKPAIVLRYGGTEPFEPYVHLYRSSDEYLDLVRAVASGKLTPKVERSLSLEFVRKNGWEARVDQVLTLLHQAEGD